jgi:nickel/cobalt transporter (NicO) family protein
MSQSNLWLLTAAASVALVHTILGPDHYVPFAGMARAFRWSRKRLVWITLVCGIGHVLGSIVLGSIGIALGLSLARLQMFERLHGAWAAYGLTAFGVVYFAWGFTRARRRHSHQHAHVHADGTTHEHHHSHEAEHLHPHATPSNLRAATPWMLFTIFLLGPCEPMIPLFMYPAASHNWTGTAMVAIVFSAVTLVTMLTLVLACEMGVGRLRLPSLEPYAHALAGATIAVCGVAITVFHL